jgi:ribosomal protein L37AE/L43A
MPDDCRIKLAVVSRKKVGTSFRWAVTFTCTKETDPVELDQSKALACGINFGWKQAKNGGLRVASIVGSDGSIEHINLNADIPLELKHVDHLKSDLDTGINEMHTAIKGFAFDYDDRPKDSTTWKTLSESIKRIKKAPKIGSGKLASCVFCWRDNFPDYEPAFLKVFESWRKADKRKREEMDNLRDKVIKRRVDFYRNTAKAIVEKYGMIGLHEFDLRKAAIVKTDEDNPLHQISRHNRTVAALSELRGWIIKQAAKTGSQIQEVKGPITVICNKCGNAVSKDDKTDFIWRCDKCSEKWDQDVNAAQNVLDTMLGNPANHKLLIKASG